MSGKKFRSGAAKPLIVGIGGTLRAGSSTEKALRISLAAAAAAGADTLLIGAESLVFPPYGAVPLEQVKEADKLIEAVRKADGILLASPGYHGGMSGLMKNAIDYVEETSKDASPYFEGRAVGCIATAAGVQATVSTLTALRSVVHALRGWPTPFGVSVNTAEPVFDGDGGCLDPRVQQQLELVACQVVDFAFQRVGG